jgi:hypothetical protein
LSLTVNQLSHQFLVKFCILATEKKRSPCNMYKCFFWEKEQHVVTTVLRNFFWIHQN